MAPKNGRNLARGVRYPDQPPAYSPRKTRTVPAAMRPMLNALPACPIRFRVIVSPITANPARVRMFMPKRISLVSTLPLQLVGRGCVLPWVPTYCVCTTERPGPLAWGAGAPGSVGDEEGRRALDRKEPPEAYRDIIRF